MANALTKLADAVAVERPASSPTVLPNTTKPEKWYYWQKCIGGFKLIWLGGKIDLVIGHNCWTVKAKIGDIFYAGERPTLEQAFRVADKLLWEKERDIWLKCIGATVFREFEGDLTTL